MRAPLKRVIAIGMLGVVTGCGLIAGFGDTPELGDITEGTDSGAQGASDATTTTDGSQQPGTDGSADAAAETSVDGGCPGSQVRCASGCTDTTNDRTNCGTCGKTCGTGYACTSSVCDDAVVAMSVGGHHACAKLSIGAVYCWGKDDNGQVGNGDAGAPVTSPVLIPRDDTQATFTNPTQLSLGNEHSCALFANGTMRCWGSDYYGQLSNAQFSNAANDGGPVVYALPHASLQATSFAPNSPKYSYASLGVGSNADHGCAATVDAGLVCWGNDNAGQVPPDGGGFAQSCGPVGNPTTCYPLISTIGSPTNVTQIAVGSLHACAVDGTGVLTCWGNNSSGQIGVGTHGIGLGKPPTVVPLDAGSSAKEVAAGLSSTCVLLADGSVWCWGLNTSGELGHDGGADAGDGNCCLDPGFCSYKACTGVPSKVQGLGPASSVAVGCSHACALENDGTVWCWGANDKGQLGTGDNTSAGFPRQVSGLTGAKGVSLGCDTSCAWKGDGTAWCWGLNADGELANGNPTNASTPTQVVLP